MLKMVSLAFLAFCAPASAQDGSGAGAGFINLTASEITSLKLSPAGKAEWTENQRDETRGETIGYNRRMTVANVEPGVYDVKFRDKLRRECVLKNIDIGANTVVSIEEKKLVGHCRLM
jgi:hypothetical protein